MSYGVSLKKAGVPNWAEEWRREVEVLSVLMGAIRVALLGTGWSSQSPWSQAAGPSLPSSVS